MPINQKTENTLKTLQRIRDILLENGIVDERIDRICEKIDVVLEQMLEEIKNGG